ncbi:DUF58 domain-containing protein [Clostridium sp. WILCCON 0269]|uniref:DUF58 domain-containing protein n=1 Tax=Candidatus Clostridium eludens TaxID=3381663 RepID=A0ABW8SNK6_9CLOT
MPIEIQNIIDSIYNFSKNNMALHEPDTYSSVDKYGLGDNFKNIHWKISAKRNNLYVKKFDSIKKQNIRIYIDMTDYAPMTENLHNVTDENLVSFSLSIIKYLLWKNETIYLSIENLEIFNLELKTPEDYFSVVSYYLRHRSMGRDNFFNRVLQNTTQNDENYETIFIITNTILSEDLETIAKIKIDCKNLIIFTLLDVSAKMKNLLSRIDVDVIKVTV